jgi:class 3 adenylate cyclase
VSQGAETGARTVLFADISDSTRLYDALGTETARRAVVRCLDVMAAAVERGGGTVVDQIGDELMCTFPDVESAARASGELHRAVERANADSPVTLRIRIGFHHGPLVAEHGRIFGDTVHVARRIASLAKPQQTLTSRQCNDRLRPAAQIATRFVDRTHLKGKDEDFEIYEVVWDVGAATVAAQELAPAPRRAEPIRELMLRCGGRVYVLDSIHPRLTIGRDARADVVVEHARVSRLHGRIEYRKNTFVFVDESTNGTQVLDAQAEPRYLRREECPLLSEGRILLGPRDSDLELPELGYQVRWKDAAG